MRRDTGRNLLLAVCAFLFPLVVVESGARVFGRRWMPILLYGPETCTERHPELGLVFRPSCTGLLGYTHFNTNADRLRGPELRRDPSARILAIGDSCTWGYSVPEASTYPRRLEALANAAAAAPVQVINAGFPGYTSHQGVVFLRERGLAFAPRVVIAGYGFNDQHPDGDIAEQLAATRRLGRLVHVDEWFLVHSRLYQWVRLQLAPKASGDRPRRVPPERYADNLRTIVALARAHGAVPVLLDFWAPGSLPQYTAVLPAVAAELGVALVAYDGPRMDVVHPTAEGYERLAARLVEVVRAAL
jgi:lysophospholipase L1-like esterase